MSEILVRVGFLFFVCGFLFSFCSFLKFRYLNRSKLWIGVDTIELKFSSKAGIKMCKAMMMVKVYVKDSNNMNMMTRIDLLNRYLIFLCCEISRQHHRWLCFCLQRDPCQESKWLEKENHNRGLPSFKESIHGQLMSHRIFTAPSINYLSSFSAIGEKKQHP